MNMKKNGFCMESISKGKSYDNLLPSKIPQNSSNYYFYHSQLIELTPINIYFHDALFSNLFS